ncbi:MAG: SET domain-containing protein-lysine N-methyltransferase [Planctomycetes bacterium]|nr:SET domain-containing protein-lysine N-methyltransferase [Planctomycetota bacterium]
MSKTPPMIEVRTSAIQGRGLFATRRIRAGTRIIEYVGELIDNDEADRRYDDEAMGRHHTFLFAIDEQISLDGGRCGNESRYINHSCDPNCDAIDEDGHIFIEAARTIAEGEELTYDYAYERDGSEDEETIRRYVCRCAARSCRGTILAPMAAKKRPRPRVAARRR